MDAVGAEAYQLMANRESNANCNELIQFYLEFENETTTKLRRINDRFSGQWMEFEREWMSWTAKDIVLWFRYKTMGLDTDDIDWNVTLKALEKQHLRGDSLPKINDLLLPFIGVSDSVVVAKLV